MSVDLEGVASRLVSRAISQADLVLTLMRASTLPVAAPAVTLKTVFEQLGETYAQPKSRPTLAGVFWRGRAGGRGVRIPHDEENADGIALVHAP